eukprot:23878-Chlamydomonas_euryale.AAC.3
MAPSRANGRREKGANKEGAGGKEQFEHAKLCVLWRQHPPCPCANTPSCVNCGIDTHPASARIHKSRKCRPQLFVLCP